MGMSDAESLAREMQAAVVRAVDDGHCPLPEGFTIYPWNELPAELQRLLITGALLYLEDKRAEACDMTRILEMENDPTKPWQRYL